MIKFTLALIIMAIVVFVIRLLVTKNLYDKLMTLNLLTIKIILLLAVYAAMTRNALILDIALTSSLVGFVATAILIIYSHREGRHE